MTDGEPAGQVEKPQGYNPFLAFLTALQFLTTSPSFIQRPFTPKELGQAVGFFPLVGALLGGLLLGISWLLALIFPTNLQAALVLALWVILTGALHLDGFLDACDGLLGGFTPESRMHILKDERVGAFALAGGLILFLVKFTALAACLNNTPVVLIAPVLGRWVMSLAIYAFPYARAEGLGRAMKDNTSVWQVALATGIALAFAGLFGGGRGLIAVGAALLTAWAGARFTLRRIPGMTGDIYGALNEVVEAVVLLTFAVQ